MRNKLLKAFAFVSASVIATSCSLFEDKFFDWMIATSNNTRINYCLLIGQNEHSDSIERTRWTREALGTRDAATEINNNANLGTPKVGELVLGQGTQYEKTFKVTEVEHMEQKSLAGVVWDGITANNTTATWINKHGQNMTMLISNNDGMAEGAMNAYNYIKGMPLFGYDANTSTMRLIKDCKETGLGIMGTVDQNAAAQTSAAFMIIRNICDDLYAHTHANGDDHGIGTRDYDPTARGFSQETNEIGVYIDGFSTLNPDHEGIVNPNGEEERNYPNNMKLDTKGSYHEILSKSVAIDTTNIDDYFIDDPENPGQKKIAEAKDLAWDDELGFVHKEGELKPILNRDDKHKKDDGSYQYKVCHIYNNSAETYLQGTMHDYYSQYALTLGIDDVKFDGDGVSEQTIFDRTEGALSANIFDAFLVNMVTTTDGMTFVKELSDDAARYEGKEIPTGGWDNWEDRLDTPLIFWNKQPQIVTGDVDSETMNNRYFKYTYFVGVDAAYGGKVQGEMIVDYLNRSYLKCFENK